MEEMIMNSRDSEVKLNNERNDIANKIRIINLEYQSSGLGIGNKDNLKLVKKVAELSKALQSSELTDNQKNKAMQALVNQMVEVIPKSSKKLKPEFDKLKNNHADFLNMPKDDEYDHVAKEVGLHLKGVINPVYDFGWERVFGKIENKDEVSVVNQQNPEQAGVNKRSRRNANPSSMFQHEKPEIKSDKESPQYKGPNNRG